MTEIDIGVGLAVCPEDKGQYEYLGNNKFFYFFAIPSSAASDASWFKPDKLKMREPLP